MAVERGTGIPAAAPRQPLHKHVRALAWISALPFVCVSMQCDAVVIINFPVLLLRSTRSAIVSVLAVRTITDPPRLVHTWRC